METTLYRATWPNGEITVWRSLNWKEYRRISNIAGEYARYAEVYRTTLIAGSPVDVVIAGIPKWIGRYELETNPFSGNLKPIRQQREQSTAWCQQYLNAGRALIAGMFGYKFEEMDEWDSTTFFNRLAQAEYFFGKPFEPADPNAPAPVDQAPKSRWRKLAPPRRT